MSIKKSKVSHQKQLVDVLGSRLADLLKDNYLQNLPEDLKQKIKDFKNEVEEYKISQDISQYKEMNGKILDSASILDIIVKASGYNKWILDEVEPLDKSDIEDIKNTFGVSFTEEFINKYRYYRSTPHRNDVCMITVTAMPGYNQVAIDTDRVGVYVEHLVTAKEMKREIEAYC